MRSVVYELQGPGRLVACEHDVDERLGPHDILGETAVSAISPGTELAAWSGKPPLRPSRAYPRLVGYCNLAVVRAVGDAVAKVAPGDHILTHQSHRSSFRCGVSDVLLSVDARRGLEKSLATAYLFHLGYAALLRGGFQPGLYPGVVGIGTLGLATALLLRAMGAEPVLFTGAPARQAQLRALGFQHVFEKRGDWRDMLSAVTAMDGRDLVIDTSDAWDDYALALQLARRGGTIVCLGFPGRGDDIPTFNPLASQYFYDKQLTVSHCGHVAELDAEPIDVRFTLKRNMRYLASLIERGVLDPSPLISLEASWSDLASIYQELAARRSDRYTALLNWQS